MLRRSAALRSHVASKLHTSTPIYETLQAALATSRFDSLSAPQVHSMVADLHQHHIFNLGCWRDASSVARERFASLGEEAKEAAKILDTALERAEHQVSVPKILICYGSQSGQAEALARWTGVIANTNTNLVPVIVTMNEAANILKDTNNKDNFVAVTFVVSTYGVGAVPTNATKFMDSIKDDTELRARLSKLPHAVFGLGNSNNPNNFNAGAKNLSEGLKKLGSTEITPPVFSCELAEEGHDSLFRTWKHDLWTALNLSGISKAAADAEGQQAIADVYNVEFIVSTKAESLRNNNGRRVDWFEAPVTWNYLMTPPGYTPRFREMTVELNFERNMDILGRKLDSNDVLLVHPKNSRQNVDRALKLFNLNGFEIIEATPKTGAASSFFDGKKIATRTLFKEVIDLNRIPSRSTISSLVSAARDEKERSALKKLAEDSSAGNEYSQLIESGKYFSILDVLERFPSVKLTLAQALTRLPIIQPRKYSNCHNKKHLTNKFELCYRVPEVVPGLATTTLESCVPGASSLWCSLEAATTTMPSDASNTVFIGLGSGVGLVHNALQGRQIAKNKGEKVGKAIVIVGCRHLEKDHLFKEELEKFKEEGLIQELIAIGSYDVDGVFMSPFDAIDRNISDFINKENAEIMYAGIGGSVPRDLENRLRAADVDVDKMQQAGTFHTSYFTSDVAFERKKHKLSSSS